MPPPISAGLAVPLTSVMATVSVGLGTMVCLMILLLAFSFAANAQNATVLWSFSGDDGAIPYGGLVLSSNTLYGTAGTGGTNSTGTAFKINTDGTGFTLLHTFDAASRDGAYPGATLVSDGGRLYGTARFGGTGGSGTVFRLSTDGTGFAVLRTFSETVPPVSFAQTGPNGINDDGAELPGGLALSGGMLYGTTHQGGTNGNGTVFQISTNGTNFMVLWTFSALSDTATNSDGAQPFAGLVLSGDALYGTTTSGGTNGHGVVFELKTNGTGFTVLKAFSKTVNGTNNDGAFPFRGLVLSGNTLYGTTLSDGTNGTGTLFKLNTDGSGFAVLKTCSPYYGGLPDMNAGVVANGATLYGTSFGGGSMNGTGCSVCNDGYGTVFQINTDGTGFSLLNQFNGGDGATPNPGLVLNGSTLYATTQYGGNPVLGWGTVVSIGRPPVITVTSAANPIQLSWNTVPGRTYQLQSNTNLARTNWINLGPARLATNANLSASENVQLASPRFFRVEMFP
jgi:uncharacterized repeat protein (TIGR03803 family)